MRMLHHSYQLLPAVPRASQNNNRRSGRIQVHERVVDDEAKIINADIDIDEQHAYDIIETENRWWIKPAKSTGAESNASLTGGRTNARVLP